MKTYILFIGMNVPEIALCVFACDSDDNMSELFFEIISLKSHVRYIQESFRKLLSNHFRCSVHVRHRKIHNKHPSLEAIFLSN